MDKKESFVLEGIEVKKTGRTAVREIKNAAGKITQTAQIVEVTPVEDGDWKKWVDPKLLFIVQ